MEEKLLKQINKINFKAGFTLIEVIIIIAIIGILSSIAMPNFTGISQETTKKADLAYARTIASAVTVAMAESYDVSLIESQDIERYLSNIEIVVGSNSADGWSVVFISPEDVGIIDDTFIIYKDGIQVLPEHENTDI